MKLTNCQIAWAYSFGVYIINILFFLADIFSITIFSNLPLAICLMVFAMCLSLIFNYKKYQLMKDEANISFFRAVIFDTIIMLLGYIGILIMNEKGYLNLITCVISALTMIPLIKTNKKIKL